MGNKERSRQFSGSQSALQVHVTVDLTSVHKAPPPEVSPAPCSTIRKPPPCEPLGDIQGLESSRSHFLVKSGSWKMGRDKVLNKINQESVQ